MPEITFLPSGKSICATAGSNLLESARAAGVEIDAPCGGKGTCGKCVVRVASGALESDSLGVLSKSEVADGYLLACKATVLATPATVDVPEQVGRKGGKFTSASEDLGLVRQDLFPRNWQFDPLALKWFVHVPQPRPEDGLSDLDRLTQGLQTQWGQVDFVYPLSVVRAIPAAVRKAGGDVTVTMIQGPGHYHVIGIEAGNQAERHYGVAVDVGTTTVAVQLIYLPVAEPVATVTDYNDQIACGLDVISRINYARRPGGLDELRRRILGTINRLLSIVISRHGIKPDAVCNAVLSGNTTMTHLLLGVDPEHIRLEPYTPALLKTPYLTAAEVGLDINPQSWVYFSPCVGSYVGGDITAGMLCTDLATGSEKLTLLIDIGTNGELVLGNCDFLMACACSAGPAFEGGGIRCGMRAALGAIENVEIDPDTGDAACQTIGGVKPLGVCGSGMIALIAKLLLGGWLDSAGKLTRSKPSPAIQIDGRHARYILVPASESGTDEDIAIGEVDFDNIIRTKAAIYSACALMLEQVGMAFADLERIYIAGGFGRFLDLEMAIAIGLIPDVSRDVYKYIGNSSLTGSYMVLVSQEYRERQLALANRMTYIDLGSNPQYMDQYVGAMFLPHTDLTQFPTVKAKLQRKA